jgi:hypothetical protein
MLLAAWWTNREKNKDKNNLFRLHFHLQINFMLHDMTIMSRNSFYFLSDRLADNISSTYCLSKAAKLFIGLSFLSHSLTLRTQKHMTKLSTFTIARARREVIQAICVAFKECFNSRYWLHNNLLTQPRSHSSYFASYVGAIDGTHISVRAPTADRSYRNRKGFTSNNTLALSISALIH